MTKKLAAHHHPHPDHQQNLKLLNRLIGQLEGVRRMVEDRRYCADILVQTRASAAALKKIELQILKRHLDHCVAEAFEAKAPAKSAAKIEELVQIMKRF